MLPGDTLLGVGQLLVALLHLICAPGQENDRITAQCTSSRALQQPMVSCDTAQLCLV